MHKLALDIFVDRIVGFIGSYYAKLDGEVDALVFAGGIGEQSALLRKSVATKCRCLGFSISSEINAEGVEEGAPTVIDLSQTPGQRPAVLLCQTNEEVWYP